MREVTSSPIFVRPWSWGWAAEPLPGDSGLSATKLCHQITVWSAPCRVGGMEHEKAAQACSSECSLEEVTSQLSTGGQGQVGWVESREKLVPGRRSFLYHKFMFPCSYIITIPLLGCCVCESVWKGRKPSTSVKCYYFMDSVWGNLGWLMGEVMNIWWAKNEQCGRERLWEGAWAESQHTCPSVTGLRMLWLII